jgi:hypothetical protein
MREQAQEQARLDLEFSQKVSLCIFLLGGQSDLLGSISSWRSTLPDDEVLQGLDAWIEDKLNEQERIISHVTESHRKS